jgi:hypothetical protein
MQHGIRIVGAPQNPGGETPFTKGHAEGAINERPNSYDSLVGVEKAPEAISTETFTFPAQSRLLAPLLMK